MLLMFLFNLIYERLVTYYIHEPSHVKSCLALLLINAINSVRSGLSRARDFLRTYKSQVACLLVLVALMGTARATATSAQADLKRYETNEARLAKMHPWIRPKIRALIRDLEGHHYKPVIDAAVYRSAEEQAKKKKTGVSKVGYSFHMVTDRKTINGKSTGVAASLAADIIDQRMGWKSDNEYFLYLARASLSHGLTTGIFWGLSTPDRASIRTLLNKRMFNAPYRRGWDAAHNEPQPVYLTLGEARRGLRPPVKR